MVGDDAGPMASPAEPVVDLYALLGLTPGADNEAIRAAFRKLSKTEHPDAGGDERRYAAITQAVGVLLDPEQRAQYDARLFAEHHAAARMAQQFHPPMATPQPASPWAQGRGEVWRRSPVAPINTQVHAERPEASTTPRAWTQPSRSYVGLARRLRWVQRVLTGLVAVGWYLSRATGLATYLARVTSGPYAQIAHVMRTGFPPMILVAFFGGAAVEQFFGVAVRLWLIRPAALRHGVVAAVVAAAFVAEYLFSVSGAAVVVGAGLVVGGVSAAIGQRRFGSWRQAP